MQVSNVLTRREEEQVLKDMKAASLKKCDDYLREFAECSTGRTVSVVWACRRHHKALNDCLMKHTTAKDRDQARIDFLERRKKKQDAT